MQWAWLEEHHGGVDVVQWLIDGDASVQWQARRDVLDEPASAYLPVRALVAERGWGAALLGARGANGLWADGWYSPKWISTFYTLQTLAALGLPEDHPQARASVDLLLDQALDEDHTGRWPNWARDICVAGMLVRTSTAFGFAADPRVDVLIAHTLAHQLPDGGWNCQSTRGRVTHSSFHTTVSVLEGLHAAGIGASERAAGQEFLLRHRLFRSHRTGEVVHPGLTSFSFPRYWYYDVLRAVEHFAQSGADRDPRALEAVDLLRARRRPDGRWNLGRRHSGRTWLTMERGGQPSRMITLSALRVLRWWGEPELS